MLRVLIAFVLVAGCSRSHDVARESAHESSHESPHESPRDLARYATVAPLSCRALQGCTDACADAACAEACVRRLTAAARPAYDALQACVVPACASAGAGSAPCRAPGSFACKACVLSHCAAQAASCMAN